MKKRAFCRGLIKVSADEICRDSKTCKPYVESNFKPVFDVEQLSKAVSESIVKAMPRKPLLAFAAEISPADGSTVHHTILMCPNCGTSNLKFRLEILNNGSNNCPYCGQTIDRSGIDRKYKREVITNE